MGGRTIAWALVVLCIAAGAVWRMPASWADGWGNNTFAPHTFSSTTGGIANTRHNLTMSYLGGGSSLMDPVRNNFGEICVYCHTPHGANRTVAAPLWNRTVTPRTYDLYQSKRGLGQPTSQPGPNSLTCLSCHDGATAIDALINMPTRKTGAYAGYSSAAETSVDFTNLNFWSGGSVGSHSALNAAGVGTQTSNNGACLTCHVPSGGNVIAPDLRIVVIGGEYTDSKDINRLLITPSPPILGNNKLNDDHPVGVRYPNRFKLGGEFNEPTFRQARIAFFDRNGNGHADPNEIRLYDSGDGYEVECGSCHDPHGVRMEGTNELIPSFLRVGEMVAKTGAPDLPTGNAASKLCLTCHIK